MYYLRLVLPVPLLRSVFSPGTIGLLILLTGAGCTSQLSSSFRLSQQEESFDSSQDVNTKLDLLWVIDSSGSMNVSQERLRQGFIGFAQRYMKSTWDIRVAAITTDTYFANPAYNDYLNTYIVSSGSSFRSSYVRGITASGIPGRATAFVNPSWAPSLINLNSAHANYGRFTAGLKLNQAYPHYGSDWAKLLAGNHDGPQLVLCNEAMTTYIDASGISRCYIRDDETGNTGPERCASPGAGETSASQCVNTSMNNTVRSGNSIISTIPPVGTPADAAWDQRLVRDFLVNLSPGIQGSGYEKGLSSLLQMIQDNEASGSATKFFRPGSLRVIAFVADEDDQSVVTPTPVPANYHPGNEYLSNCTKTIDGVNFNLPICPIPAKLIPVSTVKSNLDNFFRILDSSLPVSGTNYFVVSIVAPTAAAVQQLRTERGTGEIDRGDRFIELGNLVGNGSLTLDISSSDYSPMLDAIGRQIVTKKGVFTLARAPTGEEDMIVWVQHLGGAREVVDPAKYVVSGRTLTITDQDFILSLSSTDRIIINYQPRSMN